VPYPQTKARKRKEDERLFKYDKKILELQVAQHRMGRPGGQESREEGKKANRKDEGHEHISTRKRKEWSSWKWGKKKVVKE